MAMESKPLRILISPNYGNSYDQRMAKGLAAGFHSIGHYAHSLEAPISSIEIAKICGCLSIDVVIEVNRARDPDVALPPNVRHISWFQDVFPETLEGFADGFRDCDILYALGDAKVLGLNVQVPCYVGSLVTGVDQTVINYDKNPVSGYVEFSLCGFIPPPFITTPSIRQDLLWYLDNIIARSPLLCGSKLVWILRRVLFRRQLPVDYVPYAALVALKDIVDGLYRPLRGELDIHELTTSMEDIIAIFVGASVTSGSFKSRYKPKNAASRFSMLLKPYASRHVDYDDMKGAFSKYITYDDTRALLGESRAFSKAINYLAQTYPRLLDRQELVSKILQISGSLELYGPGWNTHHEFRNYHKGFIESQTALLDVYRRSYINLANNTHGLGLHSRTLECMAVGGFIFTHTSPHDGKPGGMLTSFEPEVHYGAFTPENIQEEARRWLKDEKKRKEVGRRAAAVIRGQHCWHHRAQQIVNDLRK